jgi:signal transduction histidine kinase
VIEAWPELAPLLDGSGPARLEAGLATAGGRVTQQITQTPLHTPAGHLLGRVLVFKDVTREREQQARLMDQERALTMVEERRRLGRELHDNGQIWFFLSAQAQAVRNWLDQKNLERAGTCLDRLQTVIEESSVDMRESITGLQTGLSGGRDLVAVLEETLDWYRRHCGLQATLLTRTTWNADWLAPTAQEQLLRIVQEALANIRKHAQARRVQVTLAGEPGGLVVQIEDDGRGFDVGAASQAAGHFGLKMMRERAAAIGASLSIESSPGAGCRLLLSFPGNAGTPAPRPTVAG